MNSPEVTQYFKDKLLVGDAEDITKKGNKWYISGGLKVKTEEMGINWIKVIISIVDSNSNELVILTETHMNAGDSITIAGDDVFNARCEFELL